MILGLVRYYLPLAVSEAPSARRGNGDEDERGEEERREDERED